MQSLHASHPSPCPYAASRRVRSVRAWATAPESAESSLPRRSRDAIDLGLLAYAEKDYAAAEDLWRLGLSLPGTGTARVAGTPKEYSIPSDGEANSCLYNLACVYAVTGREKESLECVKAALENGFTDTQALLSDPDLSSVQQGVRKVLQEWEAPIAKLARLGQRNESGQQRNWLSRW